MKKQLLILSLLLTTVVQAQDNISTFDGTFVNIPSVKVGEDVYRNVSLKLLEGLKFNVNGSDGAIKTSDPALAEFNGNELIIRTLKYNELIYSNLTLKYEDKLEFSLVSADVPHLTSSSSFENRKTDLWIDYVSVRDRGISEKISKDYETCICEYWGVGYADFDLDGDDDLLVSTVWWGKGDLSDYTLENYRSVPVEMYLNDGHGNFIYTEDLFLGAPPLAGLTRRAIIADFNGDIFPDIFLAETGFDASPFPGETPTIIISDISGKYHSQEIDSKPHFMHGASAGDIDSDGDTDIVATSFDGVLLYKNDGKGNFSKSVVDYFKGKYGIFHVELFDFNNDSHLDIITTGFVWQTKTQIVFGPEFTQSIEVSNSELTENHSVIDLQFADLDEDGINEIIQSTTPGKGDNYYKGAFIEIIYFDEKMNQVSNQIVYENPDRRGGIDRSSPKWIWWLKIADINEDGKLDIMEDDKHDGTILINNGDRNFSLSSE